MIYLLIPILLLSQPDSVETHVDINEVVVSGASRIGGQQRSVKGVAASIDEHLAELRHVELIRRGSYAMEPVVNNMQDERVSTTIDGMKIFYACTDKMDPVTSYVESSNLQSISLSSGLDGNPQATGNIGGSIDLRLRKVGFNAIKPYEVSVLASFETNGAVRMVEADAAISKERFYTNFGISFRKADNYKAGGGEEINFSQFQKYNVFANLGARTSNGDRVEAALIYDKATDVGYPALNMDVAKAEAIITSLSYKHNFEESFFLTNETKGYYNKIVHIMDDSHRPIVPIRMDMPGESWTVGLYNLLNGQSDRQQLQVNYDIYYNFRHADMTMYADDSDWQMYMLTWPDVSTLCTGLAASDDISFDGGHSLRLSAKGAWQQQHIGSEEGYQLLNVFFPHMKRTYHQTELRVASRYALRVESWRFTIGGGWGSRAPSITEAYGYYLNNTFDNYDYIGNPRLSNEEAFEGNISASYTARRFSLLVDANIFRFRNYIIGRVEDRLSPMTIGANGVKVFANIPNATIANAQLTTTLRIGSNISWDASLSYGYGADEDGDALPIIAPVQYKTSVKYARGPLSALVELDGAAKQTRVGEKYAETGASAYAVLGANVTYALPMKRVNTTLRLGIENALDKEYSTYSDWNHLPQKGRNVYASVTVNI
ncbi:MAG: TonB-dependent receptor [Bacteroidia bacterium]|nr:TonB-dependent receptor [Bacteroidia bacterium]